MLNAGAFQSIMVLWKRPIMYMLCVPILDGQIWEPGVHFMNIQQLIRKEMLIVRGDVFSYDNKGNIFNISPVKLLFSGFERLYCC